MEKIIIDTDPGVDDALAIMLAAYAKLNVEGITTVYGNSSVTNTTTNTLTIMQLLGKNIPVFQGSSIPLTGKAAIASSHGENGLGGFKLPHLEKKVQNKNAIEFFIDSLEKSDDLTIIVMGPSTNIAILNMLRPDLCKKIKELIILGGVFYEKGNISPVAEFNVYNDPTALKNILSINCPKVLIPINVCRKVIFTREDFNNISNKTLKDTIKQITNLYIRYYTSTDAYAGFTGGVMYDLLTIAYLLNVSLFKTQNQYVEVTTQQIDTYGQTFTCSDKDPNCEVVVNVDSEAVKQLFFDTLNK